MPTDSISQTKIFQKTTKSTTRFMKTTEPKFGSDKYMVATGHRQPTPEEAEGFDKFVVHRPSFFSVITAPLRRMWFTPEAAPSGAVGQFVIPESSSRSTGSTFRPGHQSEVESH